LIESPAVERLGWTLLHFVWEALAVALLLAVVLRVLRRRDARVRYWAACAAMAVMAGLPVVTYRMTTASARKVSPVAVAPAEPSSQVRAPQGTPAPSRNQPVGGMPVGGGTARADADPRQAGGSMGRDSRGEATLKESWWAAVVGWARRWMNVLPPVLPWVVGAWCGGVMLFGVRNLGGWWALRRLRRSATREVDEETSALGQRLARRLGLNRAVKLLESALVDSPLVVGAIKPVILFPASLLSGLSPSQLESILAHELAHVRRHDYLVNLIQCVVETMLFYHPAVWWVSRRIRIERENCCDDAALRVTKDRASYAGALAAVAEAAAARVLPTLAPAATGGTLLSRVRRILGLPDPDADAARSPRWIAGALALLLCVVAMVGVVSPARVQAQNRPAKDDALKSLAIEVVDKSTGQALANIPLTIQLDTGTTRTTTDDKGKAMINLLAEQKYVSITAGPDGYVPLTVQWRNYNEKDPLPATYTIKMEKGTSIGGIVNDEAGKPIAGATVNLLINRRGQTGESRERVAIWDKKITTDAEGKWRYNQAPSEMEEPWIRLSHPDYLSDEMYGMTPKPPMDKLRDFTGVMVMKKGVAVAGRVIDVDGQPIANAEVMQGRDRFGSHFPSVKTDGSGSYSFAQVRPNSQMVLTVKAKGYSPDLRVISVGNQPVEAEFKLEPGRIVRGRVVDENGKGIPKVMIATDTWRGNRSLMVRLDTDPQGNFVWQDAPADEVFTDFLKQGYADVRQFAIKPSDQEIVITLKAPMKVSGTVVDATTGKPVESYAVIQGIDWGQPGQQITWERRSATVRTRPGGKFEFTIGYPRQGYAVRIEADGYLPAESKSFKDEKRQVELEFKLTPAKPITGLVKSGDGKAVEKADVILCTGSQGAYIRNGRLERSQDAPVYPTDEDGRYKVPPQIGKFSLVVLHDSGYAVVKSDEIEKSPDITLQAWAKVTGVAKIAGKPAAGEKISINRYDYDGPNPRIYHHLETAAGPDGRFTFDRVPPGNASVAIQVRISENSYGHSHSTPVEVQAGKTHEVNLARNGRPVIGRVSIPESLAGKVDWQQAHNTIMSKVTIPNPKVPDDVQEKGQEAVAEWYAKWQKSLEGLAYQRAHQKVKHYPLAIKGDNTFRVEDVEPGTYTLSLYVREMPRDNRGFSQEPLANGTLEFTVPEIPGGGSLAEPLDVGVVELKPTPKLNVGDAAPDFEARTFDGKAIKLSDFKGKFVIVDFWAVWCGPCVAEVPKMKEAWEAHKSSDRFVMLSLSLDEKAETAQKFAEKNGMGWTHGHLGEWAKTKVPESWGVQGIPAVFLVGPDGKIVAKGLRGDQVKAEIGKALK
jgi:beta-lactamase regulating signal transducer with metallopeptidase domain/peroxiredoxin/protocatechuate 3,4-dioxygenase beta subunit